MKKKLFCLFFILGLISLFTSCVYVGGSTPSEDYNKPDFPPDEFVVTIKNNTDTTIMDWYMKDNSDNFYGRISEYSTIKRSNTDKLCFKEGTYILYIVIKRENYITKQFVLDEHKIIEITDYRKDILYEIKSDYSYRSVEANKYENVEKAELKN